MLGFGNEELNYRTTVTDATAAGVNSTIANLSRVDSAFASIQKRETETTRESLQLRKAFERVAKSADPVARAQQRYNKDLETAKRALREGAASAEEYDRAVKGLNTRMKNAEARASGTNKQYKVLTGTLRGIVGAAAAAGLSLSAVTVGKEAVDLAASYQQQMANVSAVTSAVGSELQSLGSLARELGASTMFSASEAAAGMENLGLAGFTTREIMASVGGTLDLAAAGQLSLARAAEISSGVLRGFNLEAEKSGTVSDVLAAAATRSNQQVEDLGEAMKFAAPTASLFGISLEEATASIAKLADSGLKGGIGGRGFQALVTRLEKQRDTIVEVIGDFDLAEEGLTSVIKRLADANISNAQAIEIFSAENLDVYSVLATGAQDAANGTQQFTEALMEVRGEAERIADIKFTTFRGLADELGGAREELALEFAGGTLGKVGEGAGALPAIERTIKAITESLRSADTRAFARQLGEDVGGAIDAIRENWDFVVTATKAATAAAVAYGVAVGGSAITKGVVAVKAQSAALAQHMALERSYQIAALNTSRAEAAKTAARVNDTQATIAQLNSSLSLITAQRAEAANQLALAKGITLATGRRTAEIAAQAQLTASTKAMVQTRRALLVAEGQLTAARTASTAATARAAEAEVAYATAAGSSTAATVAGATATGRLALAYNGLTTAVTRSGAALAFASTGGIAGIARALPAVTKSLAAATALSAVNFARATAQVTGLAAAFGLLANPIVLVAALTAAVVLFHDRLDGTRKKVQEYDDAVKQAFADAGKELPERLTAGLDKSREDLERFEKDYRAALRGINEAAKEELKDVRAPNPTGSLSGDLANIRRENEVRAENARKARETAAANAVYREQYGDIPIGVFDPSVKGNIETWNKLNGEVKEFDFVATSAEAAARRLGLSVEELDRRNREAADSEKELTKEINKQRSAIDRQIAKLRTLNDARAEGKTDDQVKVIERRMELEEEYAELIKAQGSDAVDALLAEEERTRIIRERNEIAKSLAQEQADEARAAADAIESEQLRFADTATDLMVDIWRSFRHEGESAIDVIKDYLRNSLDNVIGGIFQNFFDQLFTGRFGNKGGSLLSAGINPAQIASKGGSITDALSSIGQRDVAPSSGGVAYLVAQANGISAPEPPQSLGKSLDDMFGFSRVFGKNGTLAKAGENFGKVLGLGEKGVASFGKVVSGAGAGFAVSQGVNMLGGMLGFGDAGNTGASIGGTVGGALGSVIPGVGKVVGSIVGSVAGKVFGSLFGRKTATGAIDLTTGELSGVKDSKKDARNEARDEILSTVGNSIATIAELIGGEIAAGISFEVDAGKKRIESSFVDSSGRTIVTTPSVDDKDVDGAIRSATQTAIDKLIKGGDETLRAVASALAGSSVDLITDIVGRLSEVMKINDEPVSRYAEALETVSDVFEDAREAVGAYSASLSKLNEEQLKVTQGVAKKFDEEVATSLRSITDPIKQQAIDIAKQQRERIADAEAISDALAAASTAASAPAPTPGFNFGSGFNFFGFGRPGLSTAHAERFQESLAAFSRSMQATTEPVDNSAEVAQQAAEAQERLSQVIALNTAEWREFIEQAATSTDGLVAAADAMAIMREELLGLGVDIATVDAQIEEVRSGLASAFDDSIDKDYLSLTAPSEAAALDIINAQTERMEAARAVSSGAADEQERLNRVMALNTAEWRDFIDQASSTPEALSAAANAIERFAAEAEALGADPALLQSQVADARSLLAAEVNQDTAQRILNLANPSLAQFNQLLKEQQERLEVAQSVGANVGGVERLNALERQKFLEGLSDEDRVSLGDFLGVIEDQSGRMSYVLSDMRLAFESQITHVDDLTETYESSVSRWNAANDNLRSALGDIRQEFRGGNLQESLDKSLQRFDAALATSQQAGLSDETRADAQDQLGGLGREVLDIARELYGTAPQFQSIYDRIESGLSEALADGVAFEESQQSQADMARQSLDALKRVDNAISQLTLELPVLEESRDQLRDINDGQNVFIDRLDELIALERLAQAQAGVSVDALSQINQPLTPNTGDPVADAAIAEQIAAAILRGDEAMVQAIATASELDEENTGDLKTEITKLRTETETTNTLLRRLLEALGAGNVTADAA